MIIIEVNTYTAIGNNQQQVGFPIYNDMLSQLEIFLMHMTHTLYILVLIFFNSII